jgi:hypothetical protein
MPPPASHEPAPPPVGGMVGKRELLQWASAMAGRTVTKFEELKDGAVLVRCMEKTWPLAYEACRRPRPRSASSNFDLVGAIFEHLGLPVAVLDVKGIQAASFKACYNFLVMAFFLRNLALHSDFSVAGLYKFNAVDPYVACVAVHIADSLSS